MGTFQTSTRSFEPPLGTYGDTILFIYCFALTAVGTILTGAASENPFAFVGASREMMMHLTVEPVLAQSMPGLSGWGIWCRGITPMDRLLP
jgi:formate hydrogenlyase subunit 4